MTKDEALKMALETLKQVNAVDDDCDILSLFLSEAVVESIDLIKKALAQPEQEPAVGEQAPENSLPTLHRLECVLKEVTTPPQRKPLPFEQVDSLWHNTCTGDFELDIREFARAIESAHGIKGD